MISKVPTAPPPHISKSKNTTTFNNTNEHFLNLFKKTHTQKNEVQWKYKNKLRPEQAPGLKGSHMEQEESSLRSAWGPGVAAEPTLHTDSP